MNSCEALKFGYFKEVAVNFFVIAFRFFSENKHEEEYLRAVLRRERKYNFRKSKNFLKMSLIFAYFSSRKSEGMIIEAKSIVFFIIYNGIIFLICPQHSGLIL
jgi:hypothetical protein